MRSGDKAWIVLGAGVLSYEVFAADDELMSEAADRYMVKHPWLVRAVAFMLAGHVCNLLPERYDVLHWLFKAKQLFN